MPLQATSATSQELTAKHRPRGEAHEFGFTIRIERAHLPTWLQTGSSRSVLSVRTGGRADVEGEQWREESRGRRNREEEERREDSQRASGMAGWRRGARREGGSCRSERERGGGVGGKERGRERGRE